MSCVWAADSAWGICNLSSSIVRGLRKNRLLTSTFGWQIHCKSLKRKKAGPKLSWDHSSPNSVIGQSQVPWYVVVLGSSFMSIEVQTV